MSLIAGSELDQKVAEAVGWHRQCDWKPTGLADYEYSVYRCRNCGDLDLSDSGDGYSQKCMPPYSTDLNAAFAAAEKVGLFSCTRVLGHGKGDDESPAWFVWRGLSGVLSSAPTPALAICAAILQVAELEGEGVTAEVREVVRREKLLEEEAETTNATNLPAEIRPTTAISGPGKADPGLPSS